MHAYLFIGNNSEELKTKSEELAEKLHAKIMEFPLVKIDDVRSLNNLIRLSFSTPTLIICENIHEAGEEALNAFLKNLEEPQENIYFALTTPSTRKVLPTIVSRCQIIKVHSTKYIVHSDDAEQFLEMTTGEKLLYIDKISKTSSAGVKDRGQAIEFAESLVNSLHSQLHLDKLQYNIVIYNIEVVQKTITNLKANGNISLQLTNLVVRMNI